MIVVETTSPKGKWKENIPRHTYTDMHTSTETEYDYLNVWIRKWSHTQKSHPKWWTQRYSWGAQKKTSIPACLPKAILTFVPACWAQPYVPLHPATTYAAHHAWSEARFYTMTDPPWFYESFLEILHQQKMHLALNSLCIEKPKTNWLRSQVYKNCKFINWIVLLGARTPTHTHTFSSIESEMSYFIQRLTNQRCFFTGKNWPRSFGFLMLL